MADDIILRNVIPGLRKNSVTPPLIDTSVAGRDGTRPVNTDAWRIASGFRIGQKLPMNLIYPQPDVSTYTYASHRRAHTQFEYQTRVCVQGGEPPFKMELVTAPTGATITGEFDRVVDPITGLTTHTYPDDYGVVRWASPTGTTETFEVLVTDQNDSTVTATWTVVVDDASFVVLDSVNGSDAAAGTYNAPLQTFPNGVWKNSSTDDTYADKIVAFKAGTYVINEGVVGEYCSINAGVKPRSYIGIESGVTFDMSTGHFFANTGDITFRNIIHDGSYAPADNCRILQVSTKNFNYLLDTLTYRNQTTGQVANDNPACVVFMDSTTFGGNIAMVNCFSDTTSAMQLIDTFSCDGVLVEGCKAPNIDYSNTNGDVWIHMKDDTRNCSLRYNVGVGTVPNGMLRISNQQNPDLLSANQEICYNFVWDLSQTSETAPIWWNQNATAAPNADNTHAYRNTIISNTNAYVARAWMGGDSVIMSGDVWVGTNYVVGENGYVNGTPASLEVVSADLDANGNLTDNSNKRTDYLGILGHEIATTEV